MKVIFLDFDGVLNSNAYVIESHKKKPFFLDDDKTLLLKYIIDQTDAKVVLSTSWREIWGSDLPTAKQLKDYFDSFNIEIFGVTNSINYDRYKEIKDWINKNNIKSFVILDDITGPWFDLEQHVVITNDTGLGLTDEHANKAIEILKK